MNAFGNGAKVALRVVGEHSKLLWWIVPGIPVVVFGAVFVTCVYHAFKGFF